MKRKSIMIVLASVCLMPCSSLGQADPLQSGLAIRAAKIWTATDGIVADGVVIIKNGKIDAVGQDVSVPDGVRVLEIPQGYAMPGLIRRGGLPSRPVARRVGRDRRDGLACNGRHAYPRCI